jgi:hypothetical protein
MARPPRNEAEGPIRPKAYRFDDKSRFALRVYARQKGSTETAVLEEQIKSVADKTKIGGKHWLELYDHDEGVAELNLLAQPEYVTKGDEDEIRSFTLAHPAFFYVDKAASVPKRDYVNALWPNIKRYLRTWRENRAINARAAAEEMAADLKKAKLPIPKV